MSWMPVTEPADRDCLDTPAIEKIIEARPRSIGAFVVGRVLPSVGRRMIGPFIFFDHMGPAALPPGTGMDVRPHPHINLATVTYLFEGEVVHRDTLGSHQVIRPGEINWMTAGRGIAHSERSPDSLRASGSRIHGIQLWVALPTAHEETAPAFHHHAAASLPTVEHSGARLRILIGEAYGAVSPVATFSPTLYVEATLPAGARLAIPTDVPERAAYVVEGTVTCGRERVEARRMMLLSPGASAVIEAETPSRLMLIGGARLDGPRNLWWNFVSSRPERIEQAKRDWQQGRFGKIPGDEVEFIPLPEP